MNNVVCYHAGCSDGFVAAFVAYQHFKKLNILNDVEFVPVTPRKTPDIDVTGKNVVMFDVCLDLEATVQWQKKAMSFKVLDHHISNQRELGYLSCCHFDMLKSGAGLAWDFYNKGEEAPWWVQYTQDRDLFKFELPNSQIINSFLLNLEFNFQVFELAIEIPFDEILIRGQAIYDADKTRINRGCENPIFINFLGFTVPTVNSQYFQSEIGNQLANLHPTCPFAIVWYAKKTESNETIVQVSFRSVGDCDVSKIANRLGGGGHSKAAGVSLSYSEWVTNLFRIV